MLLAEKTICSDCFLTLSPSYFCCDVIVLTMRLAHWEITRVTAALFHFCFSLHDVITNLLSFVLMYNRLTLCR